MNDYPSWVWKGTVPSLNGLRALAIICVIASHYNREFEGSWVIGHFGVTSFFVLSGFLITLLLIRERQQTDRVSLSGFYKRRALRILPAYGLFLLVMLGFAVFRIIVPSALTWITALTYTSCFAPLSIDPHIAHTWSLSVEEHFYLLWPLLFRWARPRTTLLSLTAFVLASPVLRYVLFQLHNPALDIDYTSPSQMSSIAVGCLFAFVVTGSFLPRMRSILTRRPIAVIAVGLSILLISVVALRSHKTLHHVLMDPVRSAAFGLVMLGIIYSRPGNGIQRFLNCAPMNWLGILSYSLYLWQQIFGIEHQRIPGGIPVSLLLLLAIACASYFLVESPFLRLKQRMSNAEKLKGTVPSGGRS